MRVKPKLAIITIHKGDLIQLKKTIKSMDMLDWAQVEHVIVANVPENEIFTVQSFSNTARFIINQDRSLYHAMNVGLDNVWADFVVFVNSGDEVVNCKFPIRKLLKRTCYQFLTTIEIDGKSYSGKIRNHQNFIAPRSEIRFKEELGIFADAEWMAVNENRFGNKFVDDSFSKFHYGGLSTKPSVSVALRNLKYDNFLRARLKLVVKALFGRIGFDAISKYFLRRKFR